MYVIQAAVNHTFRQKVRFGDYVFTFTGPSAGGQIRIRRMDTGDHWNGTAWVTAETWLNTTLDTAAKEHKYTFKPALDLYRKYLDVTMRLTGDPSTQESKPVYVYKVEEGAAEIEITGLRPVA